MNYDEFKVYLRTFLWKQNDADLEAEMDTLIRLAHAELDRELRELQRRTESLPIVGTSDTINLTADVPDFQAIVSITEAETFKSARDATYTRTLPSTIYALRNGVQSNFDRKSMYATTSADGDTILLLVNQASVENPIDFVLTYRVGIPDFATTGTSWLEQEYLDLYTYTVMFHVAMFLREDERVASWAGLKISALESVDRDDKHNKLFGGNQLNMQPHRRIPRG